MPDLPQQLLAAALEYAGAGWHVLPLLDREKRPRLNNWQNAASTNEAQIAEWWGKWPQANVGVQLGPRSGIIDIECDSDAAEAALVDLFAGEFPATLSFRASRGSHRLFRWRGDLPHRDKAVFKIDGIEFRTGNGDKGAQSVFPPSIHPSGAAYQWIAAPNTNDLAPLSDAIVARLWSGEWASAPIRTGRGVAAWEQLAAGVGDGERNAAAAAIVGKMAGATNCLDDGIVAILWQSVCGWNAGNKPPLAEVELQRTFNSIVGRERKKQAAKLHDPAVRAAQAPSGSGASVEDLAAGWRCVIVQADPKIYRVESPLWTGAVTVDSDAMLRPFAFRKAVLEQRERWLGQDFERIWAGGRDPETKKRLPGVAAALIETADREGADVERRQVIYLLERAWETLRRAPTLRDNEEPRSDGRPYKTQEGEIIFSFAWLLAELNRSGSERVTRNQLMDALDLGGATELRTSKARRRTLPARAQSTIGQLLASNRENEI